MRSLKETIPLMSISNSEICCFFNITPSKIIRLKQTIAHLDQDKIFYKLIYHNRIRIFLTTEDNFGLGYVSLLNIEQSCLKVTSLKSSPSPDFKILNTKEEIYKILIYGKAIALDNPRSGVGLFLGLLNNNIKHAKKQKI
ncbi:hypothetical protein BpHYR1_051882 [Brachionus plicatilis]|uniref:Uncharacterized protein n=1 Tax=Brachionus plicatilis TaxID=10195 RepID=A0A3M7RM41_BRAPC|nr:hypothetical protein BpHYR1_051882 [Brachionus plicatilis]